MMSEWQGFQQYRRYGAFVKTNGGLFMTIRPVPDDIVIITTPNPKHGPVIKRGKGKYKKW